jgi:hypothetical protein
MPQYYLDSPNFATATAVYANATLTVLAPDGYYSSHGIVRSQVNGQLSAYAECESCKEYQKPVEGELLLDLYPGAAAAYSLDQLNTSYSGAAIRVRRASDSTEQDIGFTEEFTLDTDALDAFCTGTDGYVAVWYDQSGNARNAINANTSSQFKIYDASTGYLGELQERASSVLSYLKFDAVVIPQPYTIFGVANLGPAIYPQLFDATTTPSVYIVYAPGNVQMAAGSTLSGGALTEDTHLLTGLYNGANSELFVDGSSRVSGNAGNSSISFGVVGNRYTISNPANNAQSIKELILYPTDQSAKRAGIESDINSRYQIYWDGTVTSLLDTYPDAAAGYSLRALSSSYTGPIVRVRRASDSAETDVYALYNGDLNTSALESFCTGTDGFVAVWYDQSGEGNDAEQATAASQPKIYDASTGVVLENGKAAVTYDTSSKLLEAPLAIAHVPLSVFIVQSGPSTQADTTFNLGTAASGNEYTRLQSNAGPTKVQQLVVRSVSDGIHAANASDDFSQGLITMISKATNDRNIGVNGGAFVNLSTDITTVDSTFLKLGENSAEEIKQQTVIIYTADQSANRAGIESNINQAYNIYWDGTVTALLDDYQGAAVAYSVRALNSFYTGPLVRVRRESDNAERDIRALYNGELDTSALASFSAGTDGYVVTWYDQSGNGNDLTQTTTSLQPKIHNASTGVLIDADSFCYVNCGYAILNLPIEVSQAFSVFSVAALSFAFQRIIGGSVDLSTNGTPNVRFSAGTLITGGTALTLNTRHLVTALGNGASSALYLDGGLEASGNAGTNNISTGSTIFTRSTGNAGTPRAYVFVAYAADQSANRSAIESALNDYFNIY